MNDTSTPTGSLEPAPVDEFVEEYREAVARLADRVADGQRLDADLEHKLTVLNGWANALAHAVKAYAATADLPAHVRVLVADWNRANQALLAALEQQEQAVAS